MASADLREELNCSICLSIYTDPVNLRCGHNFCRLCIDSLLDTQEGSGSYSCPECRDEFTQRPALQRNVTLRNIAERFHSTWREPEDTGISCTYCVDSPVPAVKSCLMCEAYLCEKHLRVHSKSPEHILTDPNTSLEGRKCPVHKKFLEYYCTTDGACVCVSCSLAGEHRGHQVEMLDEAYEKKKAMLKTEVQKAITERYNVEAQILNLQEYKNKVQEDAKTISEKATSLLRKKLEELEQKVLDETSGQTSKILMELSNQTQHLETKKAELSVKIRDVEELCNMTDPLTLLQRSGSYEETLSAALGRPLIVPACNLDMNKIHTTLHDGLDNAVTEIKGTFPIIKLGSSSAQGLCYSFAQGLGSSFAQGLGSSSAQGLGSSSAQGLGSSFAQGLGSSSAQGLGSSFAQGFGSSSAQGLGSSSAQGLGSSFAQGLGSFSAQGLGSSFAQGLGSSFAQGLGSSSAQGLGSSFAQGFGSSSAQGLGSSFAQGLGSSFAQGLGSSSAQGLGSSFAQGFGSSSAQGGLFGSSSAKGFGSSAQGFGSSSAQGGLFVSSSAKGFGSSFAQGFSFGSSSAQGHPFDFN